MNTYSWDEAVRRAAAFNGASWEDAMRRWTRMGLGFAMEAPGM